MRAYIPILLLLILPLSVFGQLNANFVASPSSGCAPLFVQFTNTSTGNPVAYHWNLGNSSTVPTNNANPSTTYFNVGTYTVSLTVDDGNGHTSTKSMTITVHDTPTVSFTASPVNGCPPLTVQFTNSSTNTGGTGASYTWYINGSNSFTPNTSYIFNNGGTYDVSLVVTSAYGCTKTLPKTNYITVYDGPDINFTADKTDLCAAPGTVTFTGSATGAGPFTYGWKFGDGNNGTGNPISHTYTGPAPHTYNVELDVTDSRGCVTQLIKPNYITIHHNVPNFTAPISACAGQTVTFTNTSSNPGATQKWDFGDGGVSNNVSPTHIFLKDGVFTVTLITNENGCADSVKKNIIIYPTPTGVITKSPDSACPAPVTISVAANGPNITNYWWDFGDAKNTTPSTSSNPSHTYTEYGPYTITTVLTNVYGCKDTFVKTGWVNIYDLDDTILASPASGCAPLTVTFNQYGISRIYPSGPTPPGYALYPYGVKSYTLNFGDGSPSVFTQTATHTYISAGTYVVTGTVITNNGCVARDTILIRVGSKPQTSFLAPTRVCSREVVNLIDNTPPPTNHWEWNFGDSPAWDTIHQNPNHKYLPGKDTIKLVPYYNGCKGDTMYKVIVVDSPAAIFWC